VSANNDLIAIALLSLTVVSCGRPLSDQGSSLTAPSDVPPQNPETLVVFQEPGGFSTTDLRDAHERIIHLTTGGHLIWTADGTRLPGYGVTSDSAYWGPPTYFIGPIDPCCVLSVRFGTQDGERRAYLTFDYGHYNPGTRVDVAAAAGALVITQTELFPPGTPTLSGVVTEMTATGPVPIEGVWVGRMVPAGWQAARTDQNGYYKIQGLIDGTDEVSVGKQGYQTVTISLALRGDLRLDFELVRQ
jgi:hypothetical protein